MKKYILAFLVLFAGFGLNGCAQKDVEVKNVILMIGDGMGIAQVYAGYTVNKGFLQLERAPYTGFLKTSSSNSYITDSGAAATAMSTGKKTYNGAIAVNTEGNAEKTILESAEENKMATGIICTCSVTHATPACFYAHNVSRNNYEAIAVDLINSGIDLVLGGGRDNFERRSDSVNLSEKLRSNGYSVVYNLDSIKKYDTNNIACFTADEHMPRMLDGRGDFLEASTQLALERLSENEKGFFIMIEGSQIDWGGHENEIDYVVSEMIDFDKAVGKAFDFADKNPGTLVVVTADHETGGLALIGGDIKTGSLESQFAITDHTSVLVPVFAYGAGADKFSGMYENTKIYHKMMELLRLKK